MIDDKINQNPIKYKDYISKDSSDIYIKTKSPDISFKFENEPYKKTLIKELYNHEDDVFIAISHSDDPNNIDQFKTYNEGINRDNWFVNYFPHNNGLGDVNVKDIILAKVFYKECDKLVDIYYDEVIPLYYIYLSTRYTQTNLSNNVFVRFLTNDMWFLIGLIFSTKEEKDLDVFSKLGIENGYSSAWKIVKEDMTFEQKNLRHYRYLPWFIPEFEFMYGFLVSFYKYCFCLLDIIEGKIIFDNFTNRLFSDILKRNLKEIVRRYILLFYKNMSYFWVKDIIYSFIRNSRYYHYDADFIYYFRLKDSIIFYASYVIYMLINELNDIIYKELINKIEYVSNIHFLKYVIPINYVKEVRYIFIPINRVYSDKFLEFYSYPYNPKFIDQITHQLPFLKTKMIKINKNLYEFKNR